MVFLILYYCFGHAALMTFSVRDSQLPEVWGWEALELQQGFVPWAQYCIINIFNGMDFIPSVYVCKY